MRFVTVKRKIIYLYTCLGVPVYLQSKRWTWKHWGWDKLWAGTVGKGIIVKIDIFSKCGVFSPPFEKWRVCLICGPKKHFWIWDSGNRMRRCASPSPHKGFEAQRGKVMREEMEGWKQQMLVHLDSQIWKQSSLIYVLTVLCIPGEFWMKEKNPKLLSKRKFWREENRKIMVWDTLVPWKVKTNMMGSWTGRTCVIDLAKWIEPVQGCRSG